MADDKQFDPSSAAPAPPEGFDPGSAVPASSTARRVIGDTALSLAKGVIGAGEAAVGIADIPTLGLAGKALSSVGYDPKATHAAIDEYLTPEQLAANRNVREAKGFMPTVEAALRNPSTIVQGAVESVPSIFMGGALARGARAATGMGPIAAGALGEGAVSAGLTAEGVRQESPGGTLTPTQAGLAVASGAATAGLTALGGAIAKRLGIVDVETALAGQTGAGGSKAMARRIAESFFSEGVLEELPQSAQEQVVQNIALGKPWHDGVEEAAATGMLSGGLIGGAVNVVDRKAPTPTPTPEPVIAGLLPAPGQTVIPMPPGGGGPNLEAEAADINAGAIYGARDAYEAEQAAIRAEAAAKPAPLALPAPGTPLGNMVLPNDGGPFSVTQQHIANDAQDHANSVEAAREAEIVRLESSGPIGRAAAASMRTGAAQMAGAQRNEEAQEPKAPLALPEPADAGEKRAQQRITEIATSLPSGPLAEVQQAAVELSARGGVPLTVIPHPAGQGYTLVPTSILPEAWHGRFAGIQRDGALPQPKPPASQFAGSPSGDVSQQPVPEGMRAAVADWRRDMGTPTPKGAEPTGAPPEPTPPQLPIKKRKAAVSKAEKLTAETGREHEVVPHPFMRAAFAVRPVANVQQSSRSTDTSQQQNVYTNQENLDTSGERVQEVDTFTDREQAPEVNAPEVVAAREALDNLPGDASQEEIDDAEAGLRAATFRARHLDDAAHEAATSPQNDLPHPTAAQADAGNYRKGHIKIHGLDVSIENPAGSVRVGENDGEAWAASMPHHYGYIRRSEGADGDHVDTFIGPKPESTKVFVVDQIDPKTGKFDEHKVMLGFDTQKQAEAAYRAAYPKGWRGMGAVSATDVDGLKSWLKDGDTKRAFSPEQSKAQPRLTGKDLDGIVIREPVQVEETGETVYIERDAREALVESRSRVRKIEALLKCLKA